MNLEKLIPKKESDPWNLNEKQAERVSLFCQEKLPSEQKKMKGLGLLKPLEGKLKEKDLKKKLVDLKDNLLGKLKRQEKPKKEKKLPSLADSKTWLGLLGVFIALVIIISYIVASSGGEEAEPQYYIIFQNISQTPVGTMHCNQFGACFDELGFIGINSTSIPMKTPKPAKTPTPIPTPIYKWCNEQGECFTGLPPTPTPTPSPTPTPTPIITPTPEPLWFQKGFKCEVPDAIAALRWGVAYKYICTCAIRTEYNLGDSFSPFEGCLSNNGWRDKSCACVEEICKKEKGLC